MVSNSSFLIKIIKRIFYYSGTFIIFVINNESNDKLSRGKSKAQ